MSIDRMGTLPPLEIGQGRKNVITPAAVPAAAKVEDKTPAKLAQPKTAAVKVVKKPASEVVSSLVFAPKREEKGQESFYLRQTTVDKLEAAAKESGAPSRSAWMEALLEQVL